MGKVQKQVLIICGDNDHDNGSAKELTKLIPNAKYVEVPGDHGSAQATKEFADAVLKFFKE